MIHIRPHHLFDAVRTEDYYHRMVSIVLPNKDAPILIDTAILLSLSKLVNARTLFEFGTFLGIQTLNMAANLSGDCRIYTLDLDDTVAGPAWQQEEDAVLSRKHFTHQHRLAFMDTPLESKITRIFGDSNKYDFARFAGAMDLVYVDGGHDLETLKNDTRNAFEMLSPGRPVCIAWHDYGNSTYPQVKAYLDEISNAKPIFHVEESWTCFHLQNPAPGMVETLLGK